MPPTLFGGVFSVLPTPFDPSGELDLDSLARVIDLFLADGVSGFTALGVTSEIARLTEPERDRVLDAVFQWWRGRPLTVCAPVSSTRGAQSQPERRR